MAAETTRRGRAVALALRRREAVSFPLSAAGLVCSGGKSAVSSALTAWPLVRWSR